MAGIDHDQMSELLAAYALDALPPDEAALVEEHLADCARCQSELASLRELAGQLGGPAAAVPEGLWERIASQLAAPSARSAEVLPGPTPGAWRWGRAWRIAALGVAAALLAVLGVLSYRVVNLDHRVGQLQTALSQHGPSQQVALALANPANRTVNLTGKTSSLYAEVVYLPDGRAYWVDDNLGRLPPGRTYQMWALSSGKVVSLGVLGPAPSDVAFRVERTMTQLMVTAEPTGGVPAPTTPVLVAGPLTAQ